MKQVVCFGAGRVAGPLVDYAIVRLDCLLRIASAIPEQVEELVQRCKIVKKDAKVIAHVIDVMDDEFLSDLETLCKDANCVVALVPEPVQVKIAQFCVKHNTPLVTASYVSPGMKELHQAAEAAGIPILCEMGLDPGMDHMIAMKMINDIRSGNGEVVSLTSVCGGLPAPKNANNPIKYKFSWSPEGVLRAAQRPAQYLEDGNVVSVEGPNMLSHRQTVDFFPGFDIEQIPNGYSLPYLEYYRIPEARSIFRGTLRYTGFCHIMQECLKLGLLSESIQVKRNQKWKDIIRELPLFSLTDDLTRQFLDWLGIFSNENAKVKKEGQSLMRAFCDLLLEKLSFLPNEQDLVLMYIGIEARYPDGEVKIHEARFEALGKPNGDTIMSKTVGITAAIGVKLILESQIKSTGIVRPTSIEVYDPCLKLLESEGIIFQERILNRMK